MEENQRITSSNEEESIDILALLVKYLAYWPWFVASVLVCCIGMYIYLRYKTPVYNATASVLIKEQDKRNNSSVSPLSAVQDLGMFSMTSNFDNEVEILQSRTLIKKIVSGLDLYISMTEKRTFGYDQPLYKATTPLQVYMTPEEADKLTQAVTVEMEYVPKGSMSVTATYYQGEKQQLEKTFEQLPAVLPTPVGVITFRENDAWTPDTTVVAPQKYQLKAVISSPTSTAMAYGASMSVEPTSKTTTIAQISVQNTVKTRGEDFINQLVANYNQDANDEKNQVAQRTAEFIEERIEIINSELGSAETQLADFKQRSGLTNLTSDAQLALQENSKYEQQLTEISTQIRMVQFLRDYINNPSNADEVIPANVGLQDVNLSSVIDQYNNMMMERKRLLRTSSENNPAVININSGIQAMRRTVQTTVNSVLKGLEISLTDVERQARKFEGRISEAPKKEKEFMTISRQQEIKATLYIMLLQKREENAITLAATANNGRIIEEPLTATQPVAPKKMKFMLMALAVGVLVPAGIIYVNELLKYKIEGRDDVMAITKVPLLGEVALNKGKENPMDGGIVIKENRNDLMEETFRGLRTNLLFMLKKDQKVILFTSTQPGEGKSFVAGNLALSLSLLKKKVIIVGMDIRKPGLNKVFRLSTRMAGITNYLSDPEHVKLTDLIQHSDLNENLDILPGGSVPPNPTELVARDTLEVAVDQLKAIYDYVILDTAPIAIITDTAIIGRVADACVYICRADVTPKAGYAYINELQEQKKFPVLATVLNGVDMSQRKNRYGYGYGKRYGYGKGYGKGYGYGYSYGYGYGYGKSNDSNDKKEK